jgi:hypothetical protein
MTVAKLKDILEEEFQQVVKSKRHRKADLIQLIQDAQS